MYAAEAEVKRWKWEDEGFVTAGMPFLFSERGHIVILPAPACKQVLGQTELKIPKFQFQR